MHIKGATFNRWGETVCFQRCFVELVLKVGDDS